jgi:AcrR family transcriptional regulator
MRRRAQRVDETRERITEAAVRLHTTVGPSRASIAAIAEAAGVTRLTVYRHFADLDAVYLACMAHWAARNPRPDADAWRAVSGLEPRARRAFTELYAWFGEHADALDPINRDLAAMPASARARREAGSRAQADAIAYGPSLDVTNRGSELRLLLAVARHLVEYATWRSLAVDQGLGAREVVDVAVRMLQAVTPEGRVPAFVDPQDA